MGKFKYLILLMVVAIIPLFCVSAQVCEAKGNICYTQEEVVEYVRQKAVQRQETIVVEYRVDKILSEKQLKKITEKILWEQTDNPQEGDYLAYHYSNYGCSCKGTYVNGMYNHTITYNFEFYTNKEQELLVEKKVKETLEKLGINADMSEFDKVKLIYDFICENVKYKNVANDNNLDATAYSALINGEAICQGYANLFYRLAREAGLDARIIHGTSHEEAHAWNIVKIENKYYYVDSTWDSETKNYKYFLKGSERFLKDHKPSEEYVKEEFLEKHDISTEDYQYSDNMLENWISQIKSWVSNIAEIFSNLGGKLINF